SHRRGEIGLVSRVLAYLEEAELEGMKRKKTVSGLKEIFKDSKKKDVASAVVTLTNKLKSHPESISKLEMIKDAVEDVVNPERILVASSKDESKSKRVLVAADKKSKNKDKRDKDNEVPRIVLTSEYDID